MLVAMTTADTIDYVSDLDPCKTRAMVDNDPNDATKGQKEVVTILDGATVFKLRPLDVFLMAEIYDRAQTLSGQDGSGKIGIHTHVNQTNLAAVKHGLTAITNFKDGKGNLIHVKTTKEVVARRQYEVIADDTMNSLGTRLIQELAGQIKRISEVSAEEEKNSAGA